MKTAILLLTFAATNALASVNCSGVPQATKVGEFGNQEGYLIVTVNNLDFRLGPISDQAARSRLALATTALAANKNLLLRFWDPYNDCASARVAQFRSNSAIMF